MHSSAIEHLRRTDPALAKIIDEVGDCRMTPRTEGSHFDALVRAIVYQQLSGKAAATIHGRFQGLYGNRPPTPEEVLATDDERLRSVGLSRQKIASIRDLAAKVAAGDVPIDRLDSMPDDEVIESLIRVRGIGRWSAQMFLMFRLGRPNVLPDLDLGVQKGIQHAYRLASLPKPKDVLRIGERWAPFASVASWYMWRVLELPWVIARESQARSAARTGEKSGTAGASAARKPARSPARPATAKGKARSTPVSSRKKTAAARLAAGRSRSPARAQTKTASGSKSGASKSGSAAGRGKPAARTASGRTRGAGGTTRKRTASKRRT